MHSQSLFRKSWLISGLFVTFTSYGQPNDTTTSRAINPILDTIYHSLAPVEVRSLRAGSLSPFTQTEISGKELEKNNLGQDLPWLLQHTPSAVSTSDAGAGIGYTGLRIRGTDGTRINVTLNGIPVNDAESHGTFFVNLPDLASSTGSVQIQRGVGTSTNGSGAFGATISISNMEQMPQAGVETFNSYGSFNTWKNTIKAGTGLLKNGMMFDIRLSRIVSDGFRDRSASDLQALQWIASWKLKNAGTLRFMMMTGKERTGQAWNGVHQAQWDNNADEKQRHYKHNLGYLYFSREDSINFFQRNPRKYNYFTYKNQTDNYNQQYYQLFYDQQIHTNWTLHLAGFLTRGKGYYEEYKPEESYEDYGLENYITPSALDTLTHTDLIRQLWLDNYFFGSVFSLMYQSGNAKINFGGSVTRYNGKHYGFIKWADQGIPYDYQWYHLPAWKQDMNFYVKGEQLVHNKWLLFGDLQYRQVTHHIEGFRKNPSIQVHQSYSFFNPKAGLTWLIQANSHTQQKAYASFAIANKEPNRDDFEANPDDLPKPEQLYDLEAGYSWKHKHLRISATAYYMYYHNQLIMTGKINDVGAYTRTNVPESYRTGVELEAAIKFTSWLKGMGNISLSQNKIKGFTEYIDNWDSWEQDEVFHGTTDIAFSPSTVGSATITINPFPHSQTWKGLEVEVVGKHVGKQYLDNTGNKDRILQPYFVTDARIRYNFPLTPFREIGIIAAIQNLLDNRYVNNGYTYAYRLSGQTYTDNYYYPQAGINWMLGVSLKW